MEMSSKEWCGKGRVQGESRRLNNEHREKWQKNGLIVRFEMWNIEGKEEENETNEQFFEIARLSMIVNM